MHPSLFPAHCPRPFLSLTLYPVISFFDHSSIFMYFRSCRRGYKMVDPSPLFLLLLFFLFRSLHDSVVFSSYPLSISLLLFPLQLHFFYSSRSTTITKYPYAPTLIQSP
ncbi:MAG: hypothetical protein JOS17DRAFT_408627 [Linnemannia elongata]|nr:MAG: hypothetical protein JOS17DRAFT_408627 [Linnemannia elongata]